MTEGHIDFRQQREFGILLNATFSFLKQNFSKLGKALIFFAGPFMLLQGIATFYYETNVFNLTATIKAYGFSAFYDQYFPYIMFLLITASLSSLIVMLTVYSYIKLYIGNGKDGFTLQEVWQNVPKYFLRILGATFVCGLVLIVGLCMCILPGIYLGVSLSLIIVIIIFEDKPFGAAFSRSFKLTHYHWWWIVLLFIVIYAIIYIIDLIFEIPQLIIMASYGFHTLNHDVGNYDTIKYLMIIFTIIKTFVSSLLMGIIFIALTFEYFNIIEMKESPSLEQKIEELEKN
jgi:hypothetical protein